MSKKAIFISYSWEEDEHQAWVKKFSDDLQTRLGNSYEVLLDQNLPKGFQLTRFMEIGLEDSERVLVIGTPTYKKKSRDGKGVAFEHTIISSEIFNSIDTTKFYPILRKGSFVDSFPLALRGRIGDDFTNDNYYEKKMQTVVNAIINDNPIPDIFKQEQTPVTANIKQQKQEDRKDKENSVDVTEQPIASLDGVLFSSDKTRIIYVPKDKIGSFIIPNSVTKIGLGAFSTCSSLTSIVIPNSVTEIEIGAFTDCSSLTSIVIPNSVTEIGASAFFGCNNLVELHIRHKKPIDLSNLFIGLAPSKITLYVPQGAGEAYRNSGFYNGFKEIIEE
jgi:hypothetical protein